MSPLPLQINRLEGQVSRYKASSDNSEKVEDELKAEKRKLQREVQQFGHLFLPELSHACLALFPDYPPSPLPVFHLSPQLRTALDKNEEMEMTNSHLVKRLEKMKANRNAMLAQQ